MVIGMVALLLILALDLSCNEREDERGRSSRRVQRMFTEPKRDALRISKSTCVQAPGNLTYFF